MAHPVTFRRYLAADYNSVASLWTRINRELAPVGMEKLFEQYIAMTIDGELKQLLDVFSGQGATPFGSSKAKMRLSVHLVSKAAASMRRSFVECTSMRATAAQALRNACSISAQAEARAFGFTRMTMGTAQVQSAADRFYRKSGFRQIRTEVAEMMTTKQAGGGLTRFHFEKML